MEDLPLERVYDILIDLPVESILNYCRTNYANSRICADNRFWADKAKNDLRFPRRYFYDNSNPVDRYLYIQSLLVDKNKSVRYAIDNDDVKALHILSFYVNLTVHQNLIFRQASQKGSINIVKRLLRHPRVNPADKGSQALLLAAGAGHLAIVDLLLRDPRMDVKTIGPSALKAAVKRGYADVFKRLYIDDRIDLSLIGADLLVQASKRGYLDILDVLLDDPRIDPSDGGLNRPLILAAENGHFEVVDRLLKAGVDPTSFNNGALNGAIYAGYTDIVRLLLNDPRTVLTNENMSSAIRSGHADIVKILLDYERSDFNFEYLLSVAIRAGTTDIVKILLDYDRTRIKSHHIITAVDNNKYEILDMLLNYPDVDINEAFYRAALTNNFGVVEHLLEDPRFHDKWLILEAIIGAGRLGFDGMARVLTEYYNKFK